MCIRDSYRAIIELTEAGLIADADTPWKYFINPAVFWNGDRARFITEMKAAPQLFAPGEEDPTGSDEIDFAELAPFKDD